MREPTFLSGHFLIAMPALGDSQFARSVTFLCQHGEEGAMGLLVNRVSDYCLGDVLAQMKLSCEDSGISEAPVLFGGPVQPERGFVLHEASGDWDSSFRISERLAITTSRDILAAIAGGRGPRRALVALGYAGWSAGQLEQEVRDNSWLTVEASEQILFETPLEQRWSAAAALVGVDVAQLTGYAGHA
ncbi:MAG: YqgE/AlgH family protein [Mizugakiibacter sp.]|uniref:YqgE/AlgH family protein n=1 Tax=Mizugakiibacter sp. TaxID=1972610 RepID=UPI0031BF1D37|nr:YqgE/AlgH family protein [Xanthomonadaceae bacterium]